MESWATGGGTHKNQVPSLGSYARCYSGMCWFIGIWLTPPLPYRVDFCLRFRLRVLSVSPLASLRNILCPQYFFFMAVLNKVYLIFYNRAQYFPLCSVAWKESSLAWGASGYGNCAQYCMIPLQRGMRKIVLVLSRLGTGDPRATHTRNG